MRLIDADELKKVLKEHYEWWADGIEKYGLAEAMEVVDEAPTVEAIPVRHAHWIPLPNHNIWKCSNCGYYHYGYPSKRCEGCDSVMESRMER